MSKRRVDESDSDSSLDSDADWTVKQSKVKGGKVGKASRTNKKARRLSSSDESEEESFDKANKGSPEEGEVSSSDHSGGSDDSDSDDLADEPFEDGLNDDLVGDEDDRQRLAAMTEKEREEELFKRAERRDMLKSRREIELKLKQARKREERKRRRQSGGADKSPSKSGKRAETASGAAKLAEKASGSASRRRALEEKNAEQKRRMQELKAKREERMRKEKERKDEEQRVAEANEAGSKTRLRTSDVFSDAESDSDDESVTRRGARRSSSSRSRSASASQSEGESRRSEESAGSSGDEGLDAAAREAARKRREEERRMKTTIVSTAAQLSRARLTRTMLEELVFRENFRDVAVGTYVRVGLVTSGSAANADKRAAYAIGEIVDVVESLKTYKLGTHWTNRAVKIRYQSHPFRLEYVSNADWRPEEFDAYCAQAARNGDRLPTLYQVDCKYRAIREERSRPLDERAVAYLVAEKKRLATVGAGAHAGVTNHTVRKHELVREREQAELDGDVSRAHILAEQIARVEDEHARKTRAAAQHLEAVARINERNRQRNRELEEATRRDYIESKKAVDDPFARRPCRPQILTARSAEMIISSNLETPAPVAPEATPAPVAVAVPPAATDVGDGAVKLQLGADVKLKSNAIADSTLFATPTKQDDLFSMHDFDLNLDDVPNVPLPTSLGAVISRQGASSSGRAKLPGYASTSGSKLSATPTPLPALVTRDSFDTKSDMKSSGILGTNSTVLKRLIGNRTSN